ncbi:MAG: MFS transporter [Roseiarcus sp.]
MPASPLLSASPPGSASVAQLIDERPIGRLQMRVFLLCGLAVFAEGYDTQAIAYVAPVVAGEWRLAPGALGPTFAAGAAGLALGALLVAPLADRYGRRPILLLSTLAFGLLTLATAFASGLTSLLALRLLTGFGLGGAMANAIGLTAEYSPARRRGAAVAIMFCGFGLGAATAGALAAWLIGVGGWRSVFATGGAGTLLLAGALALWLPESLRFLALRGRHAEAARLAPEFASTAPATAAAERPEPGLGALFRHGRTSMTLLVWGVFFASLLDLYLLNNWLPTTINAAGLSVRLAIVAATLLQLGGIFGALTLGPLMDRFGPFTVLPLACLVAAVCIVGIGLAGTSAPLTLASVFGAGVGVIGGQNCNHALVAGLYPTTMRARGIGAAQAVGRLGSILGPLVGGAMLSLHMDIRLLIVSSAAPMLIAAACMTGLGVVIRNAGRSETARD